MVCSATDVVVLSPETIDRLGVATAFALGAPAVTASADAPFDPATVGAIRVWTSDPNLVAAGPDVAVFPLPDLATAPESITSPLALDALSGEDPLPGEVAAATSVTNAIVLVDTDDAATALAVAATAEAVGAAAVWMPPGDARRRPYLRDLVTGSSRQLLVGRYSLSVPWQIEVMAGGIELPGGGQVLFPGRRIVALYGHPNSTALGALGEQGVEAAVARAGEVAGEYAVDDTPVIPAFEIITTLATAGAGSDGDYSAELDVDTLVRWVDAAANAGMYVILDLQSGRTDFLTQAKLYAEVLALPNVGLGLDPEWRLQSDQRHLEQIGSVEASEVNEVTAWLAGLVREHSLPQKLLIVHQFRESMISNREELNAPSELAVVIQMDGQGGQAVKMDTWRALTAEVGRWRWGWKNFYDEDPTLATPGYVLDLDPQPVFVSFQ